MYIERELESDSLFMYRSYVEKSLFWIFDHKDKFSPIRQNKLDLFGIKTFSELALVFAYIKNNKFLGFDPEISMWQSFFEGHLKNKLYAESIRRKSTVSYAFILPYLLLRSTGFKLEYYEESYKYMIRWGHYESTELIPYRQLDEAYFLWKSGLLHEPNWEAYFTSTILGRCHHSLPLDKNAAYSITHTLFYMTDFGNRPLALPSSKMNEITNVLEDLLIHYWRVGNYDLMGELLINLHSLNKDNTYLYQKTREVFLSAGNEDGSIPALKNNKNEKEHGKFNFCYHTTLVGILLCSMEINNILKRERP